MSSAFYSYNPYDRYRNRSAQRVASVLGFAAMMAVACAVGFWLGRQSAAERVIALQQETDTLRTQNAGLQDSVTELRAQSQTASLRYRQLEEQTNRQNLSGPLRDLGDLIRQQVSAGVDPERLAYVIRSASPPRNCIDPDTKRFVVTTPVYKGQDGSITIAEGEVVMTAQGVSARSEKGESEAWFDPARPVTLTFTLSTGEVSEKKGILPLSHSVVVGEREYRFTVAEGARSFVKVTYDSCAWP